MSQDLTPEIIAWNDDRRHRFNSQFIYFQSADGPIARFEYDRNPARGVRPFHLTVYQFPCAHFFSISGRLANALMRVFNEPD